MLNRSLARLPACLPPLTNQLTDQLTDSINSISHHISIQTHLGFLLLPIVRMIRHPMSGLDLGRILPAKASHRSVDIEELAKRLDIVDKMLSRALRSTHRESFIGK